MVELGLIGYPLGHSYSPAYFEAKFRAAGVSGKYSLFPIKSIDRLPELLQHHPGLAGLNVTVPYKQQVKKYLDNIDPSAEEIGAVNTIKITGQPGGEKTLTGFNTDWIGFSKSLQPLLENKKIGTALVLGTGGAAHAVAYALRRLGISPTFVSRRPSESELTPAIGYDDVTAQIIADNLLIVNTTPLGMSPNIDTCPPVPYQFVTPRHIFYDLIYNPEETEFLKKGAAAGAVTKNGLDMLHLQADAAWEIWTSVKD